MVFLKLGGSLITNKNRDQTVLLNVLNRLATEIANALKAKPDMRLLIGHGSGSFGHTEGKKHGTRQGVTTPEGWLGYADVAQVAAKLNRHVFDALRNAGIAAINFQPSASAICRDGIITSMAVAPILNAFDHRLVPLVMGDVAIDEVRGGTIISTEDVFRFLAPQLNPREILLAGIERGALTQYPNGDVIPLITSSNINDIRQMLHGSLAPDVTGGMEAKVLEMLALAQTMKGLKIGIFSGAETGSVERFLGGAGIGGTTIGG
ncbi:MAG: isopentenyl phosphate kinase [Chloroflexota bacterium]